MDVQQQSDHVLLNALKHSLKNVAARICQPWLHIDAIYKMLPVYAQQMHLAKIGNEFFDNMIYRTKAVTDNKDGLGDGSNNPTRVKIDSNNSNLNRNENTALSSDKSGPQFKTFVELLIDNSKEAGKRFTHEEIREETIVLAVAATDTSATAISFIIVLLALHQDVQDKICREIQEVLGDLDKSLKSEELLKLKYTRAVIKESLRLYPPVPFITRHCKKDLELPTGLVLPRGCDIAISIWGIQRNPEHWGEDADVFNPDRFMTGRIPSNAFMAFSYGVRNCIGQQYAMLSMTTTLVTMLRRYRFTPATNFKGDKNNPFRLSFDLMLKDVDNFTLQVEHRDNLVTC